MVGKSSSIFGGQDSNVQFFELFGEHLGRRTSHQIGSLLCLGESNHFADIRFTCQNHHQAIQTEREIQDLTLQGWLEWGIMESSTVLISLPVKLLKSGDLKGSVQANPVTQSGSLIAPGNIRLGWKQRLSGGALVSAAQIWLDLPSGKYDDQTGLRSGYDTWSIVPSSNIGTSGDNWYTYGFVSYSLRGNNYSHYIQAGAEAGYHFIPGLSAALYLDWLNSLNNGSRKDPVNNLLTGLYVNNQEYMAWGIKIFGRIFSENAGIALGLAGAFSGNYVPRAPAFNLAVYYQY